MGKFLVIFGIILVVMGLLSMFTPFGRLPGDIAVERPGMKFYFPIVTSIILSIVLTLVLNIFFRR